MQLFTICFEQLCNVDATILKTGDSSLLTIYWSNNNLDRNHIRPTCSEMFLQFCNEQALLQLVNDVTMPSNLNSNTGNIIDLVLAST